MAQNFEEDPFMWLEEVEGERALSQIRDWNERSLQVLESDQRFSVFEKQALSILESSEKLQYPVPINGYVYNFWKDSTHVRGLYRRMLLSEYLEGKRDWDVIIDVDKIAEEEGESWVFKGLIFLKPDYDYAMVSLSRGGSDASISREFHIPSKSFVENGFHIPQSKSTVSWFDVDNLLVGTNTGDGSLTESGYPRTIRFWKRTTKLVDAPVVFEGKQTDVGVWSTTVHTGGKQFVLTTRAISFHTTELYVMSDDLKFRKLPLPLKFDVTGFHQGFVLVTIKEPWNDYPSGSLLAMDILSEAVEFIFSPDSQQAINGIRVSEVCIYINLLNDVRGEVWRVIRESENWIKSLVPLPKGGDTYVINVDRESGKGFAVFEDPATPEQLYYLDPLKNTPIVLDQSPSFYDSSNVVTKQNYAVSSDGTKIPYFVICRADVLNNGPAPTIQYGYGGFQISLNVFYSGIIGKLWLEKGGVYVIANIRGGGEFGPNWHQAAIRQNRQRGFNDFYAVSEDLIARGITSPEKLGIAGGSNGGLLTGVSLTQRPNLYSAVVSIVPLLDMMRYHKLLAGASWVDEYGNPDEVEDREHLARFSPYHNLRQDVSYPEPLFITSTKDDRVHPGHARKMAALMQKLGHNFLYYENIEGGHSASADLKQRGKRIAIEYTYFHRKLMK